MEVKHITPLCFCVTWGYYTEDDPRLEIEEWLKANIKRTYFTHTVYITFRSKYDAILFKMRWCSEGLDL